MATKSKVAPPLNFLKTLSQIHDHNPHDVFQSFVLMSACALANGKREDMYLWEVARYKRPQLDIIAQAFGELVCSMEDHPFTDLLGPVHMELGARSSQQHVGEFYTPPDISKLMARMIVGSDLPGHRPIRILEPACGSGSMILATVEALAEQGVPSWQVRVHATDIIPLAVHMCFINCSLWNIPARVVHGNSISREVWDTWDTNSFVPTHPVVAALKGSHGAL